MIEEIVLLGFSATAMGMAVVLDYLLERGESERREGGWETPRPPPPPPGGSPPVKGPGPRGPTFFKVWSQSAQSAFGALRTRKNVVHVCKSAAWAIWVRQSAPKRSRRNFAILTPQNTKKRRTRMQKCESDFL